MSPFGCLDRLLLYYYIQSIRIVKKIKAHIAFFVIFFIM